MSTSRSADTLTPISYDPFDADIDRDPHPVWRRMREEQPLYWNERHGFWALTRFEDVWNAYHDTATFSSSHGVLPESLDDPIDMPIVIFMDPPEHDNMRKLVSRAFTPRQIRELEAHVRELVDTYLDPFVGSSTFDYIEQFGALLPPMVIGHMLGVPEADRDMVRHWFDEMLHRQHPSDHMVSALVEAEVEEDGTVRRLTETEACLFIVLLAGAGVETVARLLSWAGVTLARNPDQRELLVQDPPLIPNAVEELLRYEAPLAGERAGDQAAHLVRLRRPLLPGGGAGPNGGPDRARRDARPLPSVGHRRGRARPGSDQHRARLLLRAVPPVLRARHGSVPE